MTGLLEHCRPGDWPERPEARFAARIVDLHRDPGALDAATEKPLLAARRAWRGLGLIGLADDEGVRLNGGRTGARHGPDAFRSALAGYGAADAVGLAGFEVPVFDLGNIAAADGLAETHDRVTATVARALEAGLMPVGIGGGHDLTFPEVRAVIDHLVKPQDAAILGVYIDAHLDVREQEGSGMAFRRLIEHGGIDELHLFGMDRLSNTGAHLDWFRNSGGVLADWEAEFWPTSDYQFFSICLDAIDMAQAPGVSAPAPAGLPASTVAGYAEAAGRQPGVCCFDIMELSPPNDENNRTARLAAHLFLRFLAGLAQRPRPKG